MENKFVKKFKKAMIFGFNDVKKPLMKCLSEGIEPKTISDITLQTIEEIERKTFGDLVFNGAHKAWGAINVLTAYYQIQEIWKVLKENLKPWLGKKLVIGLAEKEFHNMGKNVIVNLARIAGFEVIDLGNDVSPLKFVQTVKNENADILGISAIYSNCYNNVKKTVNLLQEEGLRNLVKVILGGVLTKEMATAYGADAYGQCASLSIKVMKHLLEIEKFSADELSEGLC